MTQEEYTKILPEFIRDFHDQKDLFKAIQSHYSGNKENPIPSNWVDNHIYTIDFFLWFMALHGYKLKKFKTNKFKQYDINEFIQYHKDKRIEQLTKILEKK